MEQNLIRLLKANEIECRVADIKENGLSLLLYKDARVDQRILDETFGAFGWKRSHQCIDGNLYCTVEIYDKESGVWVSKQDVGTTGYTEKEKSQASDSFKRACFNWRIGRELYSAPFIWVPAGKAAIQAKAGQNGEMRYYCNDRFSVHSIQYNEDREICALVIVNDKGHSVYELKEKSASENGNKGGKQATKTAAKEQKDGNPKERRDGISKEQMASLQAELDRTGVEMETVQSRYQIKTPETMNEDIYNKVMLALSRTKSVKAA